MKRSPLQRKTPLRTTKPMRRPAPMKRAHIRRAPPKRIGGPTDDPAYRDRVRRLGCLLAHTGNCSGPPHPHHAGERPGTALKAPDNTCICLCRRHHIEELHGLSGYFKGWTRGELRAWQDEMIAVTRAALADADNGTTPL